MYFSKHNPTFDKPESRCGYITLYKGFCKKSEIDTFIGLHSKDKVNFIQSNFNALQWQG